MWTRRHRLIECNPRWVHGRYASNTSGPICGVRFDCPEGHANCWHTIPFTPSLNGQPAATWQLNGCIWQRTGPDTEFPEDRHFETLVLSPSIRREPVYANREAALAAGALAQHLEDTHFCALHIFLGGSGGQMPGGIEFCADSR